MFTNGSFYWNELMTRDAEAAKRFYGETLGWTFEAMDQGEGATYWVAKVGDESVAGIYQIAAELGPAYGDDDYALSETGVPEVVTLAMPGPAVPASGRRRRSAVRGPRR